MSEATDKGGWWTPIKVGLALTAVVLASFLVMALQRNCILVESEVLECRKNWSWFWKSKPNEIGDTLSGFAGTLAFIWIVVTVWLQSSELAEQRKEIELTRSELKLAREAQEAQVLVMQKQADIFADEKHHRDSEDAKRVLDQLISAIALQVSNEKSLRENFSLAPRHELDIDSPAPLAQAVGHTDEEVVRSICDSLHAFRFRVMDSTGGVKRGVVTAKSKYHFFYKNLKDDLTYILGLRTRLSEDQEVRLQSLEVETSAEILEQLLRADIWERDEASLQ